jgi:hypothetical protein
VWGYLVTNAAGPKAAHSSSWMEFYSIPEEAGRRATSICEPRTSTAPDSSTVRHGSKSSSTQCIMVLQQYTNLP